MRKVSNYSAISFAEYSDGTAVVRYVRQDPSSGKMVADTVLTLDMTVPEVPSALESMFMGAAELLGRDLYGLDLTY